jgi:hypothetical protein
MKNLINHLKAEWYKYVLEIIVITIGILGAYALNNWNENNNQKSDEQTTLKYLREEVTSNLEQLDSKISISEERLEIDSILLLAMSNSDIRISNNDLSFFVQRISFGYSFDPSDGVLKDIIFSGKLGIINNSKLRYMLTTWQSKVSDVKEIEKTLMESNIKELIPYLRDYHSYRNALILTKVGKSKFEYPIQEILGDRTFENILIRNWKTNYSINERYLILKSELELTLSTIESELN